MGIKKFKAKIKNKNKYVHGYIIKGKNCYIITDDQMKESVVNNHNEENHISTFCYLIDEGTIEISDKK